jgi:hypothetical protein
LGTGSDEGKISILSDADNDDNVSTLSLRGTKYGIKSAQNSGHLLKHHWIIKKRKIHMM